MMALGIPLIGHLHEHVHIAQLGKDDLAANQICEKRWVASVTTIDLPHGVMSAPNHPKIEKAGFNAVALLNRNQDFARNPSASTKLNCNSIAPITYLLQATITFSIERWTDFIGPGITLGWISNGTCSVQLKNCCLPNCCFCS